MVISPTKSPLRPKPGTPRAADKKRKWRPPEDSPGQPLQLSQAHEGTLPDAPDPPDGRIDSLIEKHGTGKPDTRFQVVRPLCVVNAELIVVVHTKSS